MPISSKSIIYYTFNPCSHLDLIKHLSSGGRLQERSLSKYGIIINFEESKEIIEMSFIKVVV